MLTQAINISIHTTTQVVTQGVVHSALDNINFNPHHHAGGDLVSMDGWERLKISIHTTTQVVTDRRKVDDSEYRFQSTPPRRW